MPDHGELKPLFLLSDEPIAGHDVNFFADAKDPGKIDAFAETVARAAIGSPGPLTIGVYGAWGSGKTSVLKHARTRIESSPAWSRVVTVEFNAWRYEREEHPLIALVATIEREVVKQIAKLEGNTPEANTTLADADRKKIAWYRKAAMSCRSFLAGLQFKLKPEVGVPLVGKIATELTWTAKDSLQRYAELQKEITSLESDSWSALRDSCLSLSVFDALDNVSGYAAEAAVDKTARWPLVVVFVDDLDRCQAEKAFELLENIKLVLGQSGFVFVLALNYEVVDGYLTHLATEKYGTAFAARHRGYLDKIVQVPLFMPARSRRFEEFARHLIEHRLASADSGFDKQRLMDLAKVLALTADATPRTLVRRINTTLMDIALRDPHELPASLKNESAPHPIYAGLCIIQRTLEGSIGPELTRELARDHDLCTALLSSPPWGVDELIRVSKGMREGGGTSLEAEKGASAKGSTTKTKGLGRAQDLARWERLFQAIWERTFLWQEQQDFNGEPIQQTAVLTCPEGIRWLTNREERLAVMQAAIARPEAAPIPGSIGENDGAASKMSEAATSSPIEVSSRGQPWLDAGAEIRQEEIENIEKAARRALQLPPDAPLGQEEWGRVDELNLSEVPITDSGAMWLARHDSGLTSLTTLNLAHTRVTDVGLLGMSRPDTGLKFLHTLSLTGTQITDKGIGVLTHRDTGLRMITTLQLANTRVTDEGVQRFAHPESGLRVLSTLNLFGTQVTDVGVDAIASPDTSLKALTSLSLAGTRVTNQGVMALSRPDTGIRNLYVLILSDTRVTDEGVKMLCRSNSGLQSLVFLDLSNTGITDEGIKALARPDTGLHALESLYLWSTQVTDEGVRALASATTGVKALDSLDLYGTLVTDEGVRALAHPRTGLKALTDLTLWDTRVTDRGIKALAHPSTGLKALTSLDLWGTQVTDEGAMALASPNTGLKALAKLDLSHTQVTKQGVEALQKRFPGIQIDR